MFRYIMHYHLKTSLIFITCFFYIHPALAQNTDSIFSQSLSINATIHYGFYFPGNVKSDYVIDSRPFLAEIDIGSKTNGQRAWQQLNGYPVIGLGILFGKSGSDKYIGNIGALVSFIDFPLYKKHGFEITSKLGL